MIKKLNRDMKRPNWTSRDENYTMSEMKSTLGEPNSKLDIEKEKINELINIAITIMQNKTQKQKQFKEIKNIISDNFKAVKVYNRVSKEGRWQKKIFLKYSKFKENCNPTDLQSSTNPRHKKWGKQKIKKKKAERSHYQSSHKRRNIKRNLSHWRQTTDRNTAPLIEMKNSGNGSYIYRQT